GDRAAGDGAPDEASRGARRAGGGEALMPARPPPRPSRSLACPPLEEERPKSHRRWTTSRSVMTARRPRSLTKPFTAQLIALTTSAPQNAAQNPRTANPGTSAE